FFFQAEAGIRGFHVTGVQTCALPIFVSVRSHQRCRQYNWYHRLCQYASTVGICGAPHHEVRFEYTAQDRAKSESAATGRMVLNCTSITTMAKHTIIAVSAASESKVLSIGTVSRWPKFVERVLSPHAMSGHLVQVVKPVSSHP